MPRSTFYSKNYQGWPPVPNSEIADANSKHWKDEFDSIKAAFYRLAGQKVALEANISAPVFETYKQAHDWWYEKYQSLRSK